MSIMKPICLLSILLSLAFSISGTGQVYSKKELDIPGETAVMSAHASTFDGGSIHLMTSYNSSQSGADLLVIKLSVTGVIQWSRRVDCTSPVFAEIVQGTDSSYYICYANYILSGSYHILRLDPSGNVMFSRKLNAQAPYMISTTPNIIVRRNGSCYIIGDLIDTTTSVNMEHVMHLDAACNLVWSHVYNPQTTKNSHIDVDTCANGDLLILSSRLDVSTATHAPLVMRLAPNGTMLWAKYFSVSGYNLMPRAIAWMPGDRFVISCSYYNAFWNFDETVLMRCDGQGSVLWTFLFTNPSYGAGAENTVLAENNTILTVAGTDQGTVMMKHDSTGLLLCQRYYRDVNLFCVDTLAAGGYSFSGPNLLNSRIVHLTTGTCGAACEDSAFTITKTPLTATIAVINGDQVMPMVDSAVMVIPITLTTHVNELCSTIGTEEEMPSEPNVYPTPCTGTLYIRNTGDFETMQLLDVNGKIVMRRNITTATMEIDVSALEPGVYFLNLSSGSTRSTQKILITE